MEKSFLSYVSSEYNPHLPLVSHAAVLSRHTMLLVALRCVTRQKQLLGRLHLPLAQSKVASVPWCYSYNVPYVCLI